MSVLSSTDMVYPVWNRTGDFFFFKLYPEWLLCSETTFYVNGFF